MNIRFCGAAQTVTGSQILLGVNGRKILLECGLFQGRRAESYERNLKFMFDPREVDAVILSHAHIDHSGNIPNLVKQGFKGSIFATPPTIDLCKIMLRDSAYLQEKDLEWVNVIRRRQRLPEMPPIYTIGDVERAMDLFVGVEFNREFSIAPGAVALFRDAGHILGSAGVHIEVDGAGPGGRPLRLGFTGDIGRPSLPITNDPNVLRDLDMLIMECTYGNRHHGSFNEVEEELATAIRETAERGMQSWPTVRTATRENRRFLERAVTYLAGEAGIRQFLDIGTGLPTSESVHEIAQRVAPSAHVVYADNDPLVLAHARALLTSAPQGRTAYVHADLRDPADILARPQTTSTLDFSQPVALILVGILQFLVDEEKPAEIVAALLGALPPGSYLVSSHVSSDHAPDVLDAMASTFLRSGMSGQMRASDEFARIAFTGLELIPPGVTLVSEWRPDSDDPRPTPAEVNVYGGVARKP